MLCSSNPAHAQLSLLAPMRSGCVLGIGVTRIRNSGASVMSAAVSGQPPVVPVVSLKTGHLFEKRLIAMHIQVCVCARAREHARAYMRSCACTHALALRACMRQVFARRLGPPTAYRFPSFCARVRVRVCASARAASAYVGYTFTLGERKVPSHGERPIAARLDRHRYANSASVD
jgi:hypothetical protein